MSNVQQTVVTKEKSKMFHCIQFYKKHITRAMLESATEQDKAAVKAANKLCRAHFTGTIGLSTAGANTYMVACRDVVLGKDPHAGRKLANKNRKLNSVQQPVQITEQVQVEPETHRWGVGSDKSNITGTYPSRAEAQKVAKEQGLKWFDTKLA